MVEIFLLVQKVDMRGMAWLNFVLCIDEEGSSLQNFYV
jgi:hypothetical protein